MWTLICIVAAIVVIGIRAIAWTQIQALRLENELKRQMIDRGMSADEIVSVLKNRRPGERADELPCASEAVVEIDDEWQTALILRREGERYYVHVVGTEMSDNQWVTVDRVRIAVASEDGHASPMDRPFLGGDFGTDAWCDKGGPIPEGHGRSVLQ